MNKFDALFLSKTSHSLGKGTEPIKPNIVLSSRSEVTGLVLYIFTPAIPLPLIIDRSARIGLASMKHTTPAYHILS